MKVGFTGTQNGCTKAQLVELRYLLANLLQKDTSEFHHGDCVGADAQADILAFELGYEIIVHPPIRSHKRAYCSHGIILPPLEYLDRNHRIVDCTTVLIATPMQVYEVQRSGTWATVRYARKQGRRVYLIRPDGKVE